MSGDNSGPAFPERQELGQKNGLTKRELFASMAPDEPQSWFEPVIPPRPQDDWRHSHSEWRFTSHSAAVEHCRNHGGSPVNHALDAQKAHDADINRQRYIQWPWAWADAVLAQGKKGDQ